MSNRVPVFGIGDRVRIMQTTETEKLRIANLKGTVTDIQEGQCFVLPDNGIPTLFISPTTLMKA